MSGLILQETSGFNVIFVHSKVDDIGLTTAEFRVYAHLSRRASSNDGCWAGLDSMAATCRMNRDTVRNALEELRNRGMLRVTDRPGKTKIYHLTNPSEWSHPPETRGSPISDPYENRGDTHRKRGETPIGKEGNEGYPSKEIPQGNPKRALNRSQLLSLASEATQNPQCLQAWEDWIAHRSEIRKPLTPRSARFQIEHIKKVGEQEWIALIQRAIAGGWQGFVFSSNYSSTQTSPTRPAWAEIKALEGERREKAPLLEEYHDLLRYDCNKTPENIAKRKELRERIAAIDARLEELRK
jgi:hypothetical protein